MAKLNIPCHCEHVSHNAEKGCTRVAHDVLKTEYGYFPVCKKCKEEGHMQKPY